MERLFWRAPWRGLYSFDSQSKPRREKQLFGSDLAHLRQLSVAGWTKRGEKVEQFKLHLAPGHAEENLIVSSRHGWESQSKSNAILMRPIILAAHQGRPLSGCWPRHHHHQVRPNWIECQCPSVWAGRKFLRGLDLAPGDLAAQLTLIELRLCVCVCCQEHLEIGLICDGLATC